MWIWNATAGFIQMGFIGMRNKCLQHSRSPYISLICSVKHQPYWAEQIGSLIPYSLPFLCTCTKLQLWALVPDKSASSCSCLCTQKRKKALSCKPPSFSVNSACSDCASCHTRKLVYEQKKIGAWKEPTSQALLCCNYSLSLPLSFISLTTP